MTSDNPAMLTTEFWEEIKTESLSGRFVKTAITASFHLHSLPSMPVG